MNFPKDWAFLKVAAVGMTEKVSLLAVSVIMLTLIACGGNGDTSTEVLPATTASDTSASDSSTVADTGGTPEPAPATATPVAEPPITSALTLDEYIANVCGEAVTEVGSWEEGDSLREISEGLGFVSERMRVIKPPAEVSGWHEAQISFAGAFKETIDDFLEDPGDRTEDEFLVSIFFSVAPYFDTVKQAIVNMAPDIRARMAEAGCIDEESYEPTQSQVNREEIPVGGSASGTLGETEGAANFQFQAEKGQEYLIEVSWEGITRVRLLIKDPPDPVVDSIDQSNSSASPLLRRWTAPEAGTFHIELYALEGTGFFNVSVAIDATPDSPSGVKAVWEGSTMKISWDPADGAEYYRVYHDDRGPGCELDSGGSPRFCDELATDVVDTSYIHASPEPRDSRRGNYYWVAACNGEGCSEIDSESPTSP